MNIEEAFYLARKVMDMVGIPILYRGCPNHVIDYTKQYGEGSYSQCYHIVKTGPSWDAETLIHECCHALQYPNEIPDGYLEDPSVYLSCSFEQEAFFVSKMAVLKVQIKPGDLERYKDYGANVSRSLRLRINKAR